jgi:hemerythrin-like domain-containing protein
MQATEILKNEHRVIEQVLNCLDKMVGLCETEGELNTRDAAKAIDFFRHFADQCHHGKEERHLFPALEARGVPREQGPVGVMLDEHEQGRRHLRAMAEAVADHEAGIPGSVRRFTTHADAYIDLLRHHIAKEDHCLFPIADRFLTAADGERLLKSFGHVESDEMGAGTHEKYLAIADELAERYDVPKAFEEVAAGHGCSACGHH